MPTWIALLRGINVGGKSSLPMKELVRDLQSLDLENVRTYIQSGNVVFQTERTQPDPLAEEIAARIGERHGFRPRVLILSAAQLQSAIDANPFPEATSDAKTLHFSFLAAAPQSPDIESLERVRASSERYELAGQVFYLHTPDGIGRSKLAAKVERALGVAATARNWRTVEKLSSMVQTK